MHKPSTFSALIALFLAVTACCGCRSLPGKVLVGGSRDIHLRRDIRTQPRPLRIHALRFDLHSRNYELAAAVSTPDPDGDGPAHASLMPPERIIGENQAVAAINANSFSRVSAHPDSSLMSGWFADLPVRINGAAIQDGVMRSPAGTDRASFWIDRTGQPHIDATNSLPPSAWQAVAGFARLLMDGRNVCAEDGVLHPRSAVGFDRRRRYLWMVVVDGRQPGVSEGMSLRELAALMEQLGCHEALNLDGGGSSVLLFAQDPSQPPRLLNIPAQVLTRPVPVLLTIRPHT